jgi:SpoVK/Ycf46/Vps4 family AAA+-type ATPase
LEGVAERTALYTGADLESVCREAALHALRRCLEAGCVVWGVSFLCPLSFFFDDFSFSIGTCRYGICFEDCETQYYR